MRYDYRKLRGKIKEVYGTQEAFANDISISVSALSQRLNNVSRFTQDEILTSCNKLGIATSDIAAYFFTHEVQKN
uniref:HTH cro/C1-type domain-containing protein n=1 Tax=Myoviridae sp. ctpiG4 TaxID=2826698 RepID=A0A8S5N3R0_9CAUD|nr:MAG TPA: Protein of unknown function (DUF739) [Myoviridae sp. ctpiG4]